LNGSLGASALPSGLRLLGLTSTVAMESRIRLLMGRLVYMTTCGDVHKRLTRCYDLVI